MKIKKIHAREILDSRATPTTEVILILENDTYVRAGCPSGASVGTYEAKELRDNDPKHMAGFGVLTAVDNIINKISPKLEGMDVTKQSGIDQTMLELDGTVDKKNLGANAILPVSIAVAKAGAITMNMQLYTYLKHYTSRITEPYKIPTPLFNVINGGKHAANNLDFQEFIVIPNSNLPHPTALNMGVNVYHELKQIISKKGLGTLIGDEGGFSPPLPTNNEALILITEAIAKSGFKLNEDIFLGLDVAANNLFSNGNYSFRDVGRSISTAEFIAYYQKLNSIYNFLYLEDPLAEDDWQAWEKLCNILPKNTIITGDDLTTTNPSRLSEALSKNTIRGIIIKPNQIGTVTEAITVVEMAKKAGLKITVSHRSGESNDDFIADFAVGMGADFVKFGSPARGERVAKYNRLSEIDIQIRSV
jgi:enolase